MQGPPTSYHKRPANFTRSPMAISALPPRKAPIIQPRETTRNSPEDSFAAPAKKTPLRSKKAEPVGIRVGHELRSSPTPIEDTSEILPTDIPMGNLPPLPKPQKLQRRQFPRIMVAAAMVAGIAAGGTFLFKNAPSSLADKSEVITSVISSKTIVPSSEPELSAEQKPSAFTKLSQHFDIE